MKSAFLWRFHAVHHSAEHVNFLVNTRGHPVDVIFTRLCGLTLLYATGPASPGRSEPVAGAHAGVVHRLALWSSIFTNSRQPALAAGAVGGDHRQPPPSTHLATTTPLRGPHRTTNYIIDAAFRRYWLFGNLLPQSREAWPKDYGTDPRPGDHRSANCWSRSRRTARSPRPLAGPVLEPTRPQRSRSRQAAARRRTIRVNHTEGALAWSMVAWRADGLNHPRIRQTSRLQFLAADHGEPRARRPAHTRRATPTTAVRDAAFSGWPASARVWAGSPDLDGNEVASPVVPASPASGAHRVAVSRPRKVSGPRRSAFPCAAPRPAGVKAWRQAPPWRWTIRGFKRRLMRRRRRWGMAGPDTKTLTRRPFQFGASVRPRPSRTPRSSTRCWLR